MLLSMHTLTIERKWLLYIKQTSWSWQMGFFSNRAERLLQSIQELSIMRSSWTIAVCSLYPNLSNLTLWYVNIFTYWFFCCQNVLAYSLKQHFLYFCYLCVCFLEVVKCCIRIKMWQEYLYATLVNCLCIGPFIGSVFILICWKTSSISSKFQHLC